MRCSARRGAVSDAVQDKARRSVGRSAEQGAEKCQMRRRARRGAILCAAQRRLADGGQPVLFFRSFSIAQAGKYYQYFPSTPFLTFCSENKKTAGILPDARVCAKIFFAGPAMLRHGRRAKIRARRRGTVRHRYGSARGTAQHWVRRGTGTAQKTLEGSRLLPVRPALSFPFAGRDAKRTLACMGHLFSSCAVMTV